MSPEDQSNKCSLLIHEKNTNKRSNDELAEEIIIPNLPSYLRDEFELTYRPGQSISIIIRSLKLIANKTKKAFEAAKTARHNHGNGKGPRQGQN